MARSRIRFDMFDAPRLADEARRAHKLASLYHRGQELAWDGRAVLAELIARHGGIHVPEDKRAALARVFGIIMWGELAAWKISLQLADEIVALEPKMAATSQAHDEARHFYVMHDYLEKLGQVPTSMDRASRAVLDIVLETPSLVKKLLGMQLMVESLALTIFQVVRESRVEPVLCDLLRYYEKDEARHVGLGVQLLPQMIRGLSRAEAVGLFAFQVRILGWTLAGLKSMEPALRALGLDPRAVLLVGRAKQTLAVQEMWSQLGITRPPPAREVVIRAINGAAQALFSERPGVVARARAFVRGAGAPLDADLPPTALSPDDAPTEVRFGRRAAPPRPRA
jgi:hypothetical protein